MSDTDYAVRPNKTQLKREMRLLNDLGKQLTQLPDGALAKISLSDSIQPVIREAKRLSRRALQRELRRLASMLVDEDIDAIQLEIQRQTQPDKEQTAEFHRLEEWRERLVEGDDELLSHIMDEYPDVDRQLLRQLIRNAQAERNSSKPPKAFRQLFQLLKNL